MDPRYQCILLITVMAIAIVLIYYINPPAEDFATTSDKAQRIYAWFQNNPSPSYTDYKNDVYGSNVVEYEDVLGLFQNQNLTTSSIKKVI